MGAGTYPVWARQGQALLFQAPDHRVLGAEYTATADSILFGRPVPWGNIRPADLGGAYAYDLPPDGRQLAAVILAGGAEEKPITDLAFMVNFFDELKRRVP